MWKRFRHPNVIGFRGVNTELFKLALVYDWAERSSIIQYTASNPDAPRPVLVLTLLLNGINYYLTLFLAIVVTGCKRPAVSPLV